jgi:hypothetical protein
MLGLCACGSDETDRRSELTPRTADHVVDVLPDGGPAAAQLVAAQATAAERDLRPFILFTAEWCHACRDVEAALRNGTLEDALAGALLLRVDVDAWQPRELRDAGYGRPVGLPVIYALDGRGWKGRSCSPTAGGTSSSAIASTLQRCLNGES